MIIIVCDNSKHDQGRLFHTYTHHIPFLFFRFNDITPEDEVHESIMLSRLFYLWRLIVTGWQQRLVTLKLKFSLGQ